MFGKDWGMLFLEEGCWNFRRNINILDFMLFCVICIFIIYDEIIDIIGERLKYYSYKEEYRRRLEFEGKF